MRDLLRAYLEEGLSRRRFIGRMVTWGFTAAAATSIVDSLTPLVAEASPGGSSSGHAGRSVTGTGGALLVEQLAAAGVEFIFNCNSSGTYAIFDALVDRRDVQVIQVPQEGQMVAVAQGYTLGSGKIAFTMNDSVGFPNTLNNMYNGWKDRTPIVIGTQREPTRLHGGRDANEEWDDYLGPAASFTRWRWSVGQAERIPEITRRALRIASTPPGGPVALAFPEDLLCATGVTSSVLEHDEFMLRPEVRPDPHALQDAAKLLVEAESPLLVVGREVTRSGGNREIVRLAERLALPVAQGEMLFDDFPTSHPLFLPYYGWQLPKPETYDLILNVGCRMPHKDRTLATRAKVIHATIDAETIGRVVPTDVALVGDAKEVAVDLVSALESLVSAARLDAIRDARLPKVKGLSDAERAQEAKRARDAWDVSPMSAYRVAGELGRRLDKDAIVVIELAVADWLAEFSFGPGEKRKIGKTTGSALGWGVGAALGVKLAQPDRQVVALQGDGGFLFAQAETLWTMARYEVPVIVVVLNNRSYNGPRTRIMGEDSRQAHARKDMTCYLGDPDIDFAKIAAGFGVAGEVVESPDEIGPAIDRAIRSTREGRPYLIDAVIARSGALADSTWHPEYSVAARRTRKV
jgi:acetolactate synthase I/II/III large subunit